MLISVSAGLALVSAVESLLVTLAAFAKTLEARGVRTPVGRANWLPVQVLRLLTA